VRFASVTRTLFGRTALAFTLAFLIFSLFSIAMVFYFVTLPLTQRAANDLSAMAVLTAQIWVELPPGTRPDFEREMREHHQFIVGLAGNTLKVDRSPPFYLEYFRRALSQRTEHAETLLIDGARPDWRWVDIAMGGRIIRVGFDKRRFAARIPLTMIVMVFAGTLIAVVTSLLIVRRITRPLAALAAATARVGEGRRGAPLVEKGASELVELTRNFNRMERQLQTLLENRTTLLAGISHDLRTPIARMQLELELLGEGADSQLTEGMRADLDEMNEIITATLQLSRGITDEVTTQTDLCRVVNEVAEAYRRGGVEIVCRCTHGISYELPVAAFRRVLHNLVDNAVRYGEGKPVEMRCDSTASGVRVEIVDHGPGIPEAQRSAVFQPFVRLEGSRSRTSGGSGLGLAIVDQLCRLNGWRIDLVESERGGTTVRLLMPLSESTH
jgi:two-component system, OmpR family, osmolarity sensor histidine kinase EnvZ